MKPGRGESPAAPDDREWAPTTELGRLALDAGRHLHNRRTSPALRDALAEWVVHAVKTDKRAALAIYSLGDNVVPFLLRGVVMGWVLGKRGEPLTVDDADAETS